MEHDPFYNLDPWSHHDTSSKRHGLDSGKGQNTDSVPAEHVHMYRIV